jgi:hypothetical protein
MATVLERGGIFFFYRPKIAAGRVSGVNDVQRFYLVLKPADTQIFRRIIIGRKRLPEVGEHERVWGFVDLVTHDPEEIEDELDPATYQTRTRGRRTLPPARPAGEGVYAIVRHDDHTHLAYELELPEDLGPVQHDLNIMKQASVVVTVRNPDASAPPRAGLPAPRRPDYPDVLTQKFSGRRFTDLDPPDFLNYPGTEIVLIGASENVRPELTVDLNPEQETLGSADVFTELRMEPDLHPLRPLTTGHWE